MSKKCRFQCEICKTCFVQKVNLNNHMRIHTGVKPFACNYCPKRFAQVTNLNNHTRTHTGEKPFSCSICKVKFAQVTSLNNHMRLHTGEKPYQCPLCDKRFIQASGLVDHSKIHSSNDIQEFFSTRPSDHDDNKFSNITVHTYTRKSRVKSSAKLPTIKTDNLYHGKICQGGIQDNSLIAHKLNQDPDEFSQVKLLIESDDDDNKEKKSEHLSNDGIEWTTKDTQILNSGQDDPCENDSYRLSPNLSNNKKAETRTAAIADMKLDVEEHFPDSQEGGINGTEVSSMQLQSKRFSISPNSNDQKFIMKHHENISLSESQKTRRYALRSMANKTDTRRSKINAINTLNSNVKYMLKRLM